MPEVGLPPVDYRRFLSDVASGFTVLVLIVVIIPYFRETLKNWIMINYNLAIAIIIAAIIISPALGFAVNAISYAFLDKAVKMFAGERIFHDVHNKLNIVNYRDILEFKDEFEEINHYFNLKNSLPVDVTNERNQEYKLFKSLEEIEDKLSIERPGIIGEGIEAVLGGYIMLRNIAYLMLSFALFFSLLSLLSLLSNQVILLILAIFVSPLMWIILPLISGLSNQVISLILAISIPPSMWIIFEIIKIRLKENKIILLMTQRPAIFIVIIIMLLIIYFLKFNPFIAILFFFSLLMLFLSTLALVYYHWHVFLAALHVARKWW